MSVLRAEGDIEIGLDKWGEADGDRLWWVSAPIFNEAIANALNKGCGVLIRGFSENGGPTICVNLPLGKDEDGIWFNGSLAEFFREEVEDLKAYDNPEDAAEIRAFAVWLRALADEFDPPANA